MSIIKLIDNKLLLYFIYLLLLTLIGYPNLKYNLYIIHKLIIFMVSFIFNSFYIVSKNRELPIDEIKRKSLDFAIKNVIGYSIYQDIITMPYSNDLFHNLHHLFKSILMVSIIMLFILSVDNFKDKF